VLNWKGKVEKRIGREIPGVIWHFLEEGEEITYANQLHYEDKEPQQALKHLEEVVTRYFKIYDEGALKLSRGEGRKPIPKRSPEKKEKDISPSKCGRALSEVIAVLANRERDIREFRQDVLNGKLLKPEEVPAWIKAIRDKEGYTFLVTLQIAHGAGWEDRLVQEARRIAAFSKNKKGDVTEGFRFKGGYVDLSFVKPGSEWVESVQIKKSGTLGSLKKLAKRYEAFWPEALAVQFILTGQSYPVSQAKATFNFNSYGMDRVTLALSPQLTGEDVKSIYLRSKKALLSFRGKGKTRKLHEKNIALAVFAAKEYVTRIGSKRVSVTELVRLWNKQNRQRRKDYVYDEKRSSNFARDCRAAFKNLTGWKWEDCLD
jgi:hypothetical protein